MFDKNILSLKEKGLLRRLKTVRPSGGTKAVIDGAELTLFCSNDYLGLSAHPSVREAAKAAIDDAGFGAGAAPLVSGHSPYHERLARELAAFKGAQAALIFGSGYLANAGMIPALAGEGDVIITDELNHASIIDGCRLSKAPVNIYRHASPGSLEAILKSCGKFRRRFIITEGVFSMDGDVAPLPELLALAREHDATVILDEAHATGTMGGTGRGTLEHFGLDAEGVVQMGTLGKALGSCGAFVAASADVVEWLANSARSFMFSTALPPASCAAASAALDVVKKEPGKIAHLRKNAGLLRSLLTDDGLEVIGDGTPIIPLMTGGAEKTIELACALMDAGYYAPAIRPPTVAEGRSRIRFTVSALHSEDDITGLAGAVSRQRHLIK